MTAFYAFTLAIVQGVTELFPISSLGHAVILGPIFGWPVDQKSPEFLPFVVILHVGTATALLLYFWRDWLFVLRGLTGMGQGTGEARRLFLMIVVATIPAVVIGFVVEKTVRGMFASPFLAAMFLVINGFLLFAGDKLRRQGEGGGHGGLGLESLDVRGALVIGVWQCFAFVPGVSRSGAAMVGGLIAGLAYSEAAHFSFLIATPVIVGAAVLEIPKMLALPGHGISGLALVAGVVAGITAYLSTAFLMRYFRRHSFDDAMVPFAIYCWVAGAIAMAWLGLHG